MLDFKQFQHSSDRLDALVKSSLGIPRKDMPQISSKNNNDFISFLNKNNIAVEKASVRLDGLKMIQGELNPEKALAFAARPYDNSKPVFISRDGYVLDGNHRFAGEFLRNPNGHITVYKIDMGIHSLLDKTKEYDKVFTKAIHEAIVTV
jgi:hypothetical protein